MKSDKLNDAVQESRIFSAIRSFVKTTSEAFSHSLLCGIVAPEDDLQREESNSISAGIIEGQRRRNSRIKKTLRMVASGFENSRFSALCTEGRRSFLSLRLRSIGMFLLNYAIFTVLAVVIVRSAEGAKALDDLLASLAMAGFSIPLLFSRRSLMTAVSESRMIGPIFREIFGIDTEKMAKEIDSASLPKRSSGRSILFGIGFGILSLIASPIIVFGLAAFFITTVFILSVPESGLILVVASMPLVNAVESGKNITFILIAITLAGYFGKLIRGKRIFSVSMTDVAVLALLVLVSSSRLGMASSYETVTETVAYMIFYFLSVNLLRNRTWLGRMASTLVFSWIMIAFVGVLIPILRATPFISDVIGSYTFAQEAFIFGNPSESVYFLLPAIPLIITEASESSDKKRTYLLIGFSVLILACLVMGGNSMPFVPLCIGLAVYVLCIAPSAVFAAIPAALIWLALGGLRIPFVSDAVERSFAYAQEVTFENKYVRGGVIRALADNILTGIGLGDDTFSKVYVNYAYAGFEGASHAGGSFYGFLLGAGIIGALVFAAVVFIFVREAGGFIRSTRESTDGDRKYVAAALAGVCSIVAAAFIDNVFASTGIYVYFWALVALGSSLARVSRNEAIRRSIRHEDTADKAEMETKYVSLRRAAANKMNSSK